MLFSTLRQIRDPGTAMAPGNTTAETAIQNSIMAHRTVLDKLTRARELLLFVRFEVEWRYLAEKARIQFGDEPPA
jgi:hypothetical protein